MKGVIVGLSKKFYLFLPIAVFTIFIVSGIPTRVESIHLSDQKDAATGIALTCAALIEGCSRNPSLCGLTDPVESVLLIDLYNEAVVEIKSLDLEPSPDDLATANGIIYAGLITALARNPTSQEGLEAIAANCQADIGSL